MTTSLTDLSSVDEIPIYREGASDAESAQIAENDPVGFHLRAFNKHGPVYRMMKGKKLVLLFSGHESNEFIWKNPELWTYHNLRVAFREQLGEDHVTAIDGEHHRQKRTILKPAFDQGPSMRHLPMFNAIFHEKLKGTLAMAKTDTVHWWAKTICHAQSLTVQGAKLSDEMEDQFVAWEKALLNGIHLGEERFAYYGDAEYLALKAVVIDELGRIVDERMAAPEKFNDNFAAVTQARIKEEGTALSRENLIDDLYFIILAGVENTSKLISSALFSTVRDPELLKGLRAEIDAWDGQDVMALSKMSRLKATVMEAQRLYAPIMYNGREAAQDFEFSGFHIPQGTNVVHMQTLCHYQDHYYPDPFEFQPQRFVENGAFVAKTMGIFGGGTHLCLGRNYTLVQTPIALAQMLKYYDVELLKEEVSFGKAPLAAGHFLVESWARFTPRET